MTPHRNKRPLATLLDGDLDDTTPVAFDRSGVRRLGEFRQQVASLTAYVEERGVGRWLLCTEDSYGATVALLALARCRSTAVLPPNRQAETLRQLASGCVGGLWDPACQADAEAAEIGLIGANPLEPAVAIMCSAPLQLDRDVDWVEFRTSGTTGDGRTVTKALRHLEDEVLALETQLGAHLTEDAHIFATASHQHIYGLLFRVLWPLAAGRPFQAESLLHKRELLPRIAECSAAALVTTPVHLKRLAATDGLRPLRDICRAVFSSGGPLEAETAQAVARQLGAAPIEIFGSTETGGVATRRRDADGEAWVPMPFVVVEQSSGDERLEVTSPYVSTGEVLADGRGRTVMGDRVEITPGGCFLLRGRADRVVKVGEKRLALPEMERLLAGHGDVAEAALLVRDVAGQGRVHAVIAPTRSGRELLERGGRRGFGTELSRHLSGHFDPVLLPRAWRIVDRLPRDAQDKVTIAALEALFDETEQCEGLRILEDRILDSCFERALEVTGKLPQLEGHFDGFPVVAGVVQLGWAVDAATAWLGRRPVLQGVEALKFPEPLRPERYLTLRLERAVDGARLRFRLADGDVIFASGRLLLDEDGP